MPAHPPSQSAQTDGSVDGNVSYFRNHHTGYARYIQELDTYQAIRRSTDEAIRGIGCLLDIGNGGVFDYETSLVGRIEALDLFLEDFQEGGVVPGNVTFRTGSALEIPSPSAAYDGVLMVMLIHHLVAGTVRESLRNARRAFSEAWRVLRPGGRLIIVESCVPRWFYQFERLVFPVAAPIIGRLLDHPATIQYPPSLVAGLLAEATGSPVETARIPKGVWVLQYGFKVPALLTPACPYRFVVHKEA